MRKVLFSLALTLAVVGLARAHFVFVVPDKDGKTATVVFSDSLEPDEDVAKLVGLKLTVRDTAGKDHPAASKANGDSLLASLPGEGPRVVSGKVAYGVMEKKGGKPFLLVYHPKALVGAVDPAKAGLGKDAPAELLPVVADGKLHLQLLAGGKPIEGADVTLIKPDGGKAKLKTGKGGLTEAFAGAGRFGAWSRYVEAKSGEHDGKKYDEVRHYPSLVFEAPPAK